MTFVHLTIIKRNIDSKVSHINASQTLVHLRMLGRPSLFSPHTPTGDTPRVGFIWFAMGLRIYICIHLPGGADLANPCTTFRKLWLNQKDSLNIKTVWKLKITQSEHWTHSKTPLSCPRWLACFFSPCLSLLCAPHAGFVLRQASLRVTIWLEAESFLVLLCSHSTNRKESLPCNHEIQGLL